MNEENKKLHETAMQIANTFRKTEADLLNILIKIDERKVFLNLGFTSLFDYCVKALKLSEANASNFITVARKSKTIPQLKAAIESGAISVAKREN